MRAFKKKAIRYLEIANRVGMATDPEEFGFQLDFLREAVHRIGTPKRHWMAGYGAIMLLRDLLIDCLERERSGAGVQIQFRAIKDLLAELCFECDEMRKDVAVGVLEKVGSLIDVEKRFSDWWSYPELARTLELSRI